MLHIFSHKNQDFDDFARSSQKARNLTSHPGGDVMQEDLHCFALEASVETVLHDAREAPFAGFPVVPWWWIAMLIMTFPLNIYHGDEETV